MDPSLPLVASADGGASGRHACIRAPARSIRASGALAAADLALRAVVAGGAVCFAGAYACWELAALWLASGTGTAIVSGVHRCVAVVLPRAAARRGLMAMTMDLALWATIATATVACETPSGALVALVATTMFAHAAALGGCAALARCLRCRPMRRRVVVLGGHVHAALVRRRIAALLAHRVEIVTLAMASGIQPSALAPERGVCEIVLALGPRDAPPGAELRGAAACGLPIRDAARFLAEEAGYVETSLARAAAVAGRSRRRSLALKRAFDIGAAALLLALAAPLLALAAIAIRLEGPGPIFYRQRRIGRGGVPFMLLKLRSMRADAEAHGPRFAARDDPRITRVGRFLRRTRLDEVPQAIHVLSGRMSMVGPRPERPVFAARFGAALPLYARRHDVLPGITGWAQINRPYAASLGDAREKLAYDLYYVAHGGLLLDILILACTIRVVMRGTGAR